MATGSGKTTVMAMIITWQVLNALTYPKAQQGFQSSYFHRCAGLDGERPLAGAVSGRVGQLLRRVQSVPFRSTAAETQPGWKC